MEKDPVCGMIVDEKASAATVEYRGKTYHFCSKHCAEKFNAEPEKYVTKDK